MRGRGWYLLVVASVGALVATTRPSPAAPSHAPPCAPTGLARAYTTGGVLTPSDPRRAPQACMTFTGYATEETHISVTNDGSVVYSPAVVTPGLLGSAFVPGAPGPHPWQPTSPAGIALSSSNGWRFVKPAGTTWTGSDSAMWADPATGRLFMETLSPGQVPSGGQLAPQDQTPGGHATLLVSPDDGATWDYTALTGFVFSENARFAAAPPRAGQAQTAGYPDVTYWCGNRAIGLMEPLVLERECYRSLDGGTSWEMRSILLTSPIPQHPECGTSREDIDSYDGYYPQGAVDGSLYLIVGCTPLTSPSGHDRVDYLARSVDEAATFPVLRTGSSSTPVTLPVPAGAGHPELRVTHLGGSDVLVLVYQQGALLEMRTASVPGYSGRASLAAPLRWTSPVTLTPPGLVSLDESAVEVRGSEVAVSYFAQTKPRHWDGYLSVVSDLRAQKQVWTATVNDPRQPLATAPPVMAKDDFIGVAIGPDLRPWASFFSPCSVWKDAPTIAACDGAYFGGQPISIEGGNDRGVVGSLVFRR